METIGKRLKLRRIERGLTLDDVAKKVDVSANYISLIERGKNTPSDELIDKLSDLYGLCKTTKDNLYEAYGRLPATITEELEESDVLKKVLLDIGRNDTLTKEEKDNLYERLHHWYTKVIEDKE